MIQTAIRWLDLYQEMSTKGGSQGSRKQHVAQHTAGAPIAARKSRQGCSEAAAQLRRGSANGPWSDPDSGIEGSKALLDIAFFLHRNQKRHKIKMLPVSLLELLGEQASRLTQIRAALTHSSCASWLSSERSLCRG